MSKETYLKAVEAWVIEFMERHDREPTDQEIEQNIDRLGARYLADQIDYTYDRLSDDSLRDEGDSC